MITATDVRTSKTAKIKGYITIALHIVIRWVSSLDQSNTGTLVLQYGASTKVWFGIT